MFFCTIYSAFYCLDRFRAYCKMTMLVKLISLFVPAQGQSLGMYGKKGVCEMVNCSIIDRLTFSQHIANTFQKFGVYYTVGYYERWIVKYLWCYIWVRFLVMLLNRIIKHYITVCSIVIFHWTCLKHLKIVLAFILLLKLIGVTNLPQLHNFLPIDWYL